MKRLTVGSDAPVGESCHPGDTRRNYEIDTSRLLLDGICISWQ